MASHVVSLRPRKGLQRVATSHVVSLTRPSKTLLFHEIEKTLLFHEIEIPFYFNTRVAKQDSAGGTFSLVTESQDFG